MITAGCFGGNMFVVAATGSYVKIMKTADPFTKQWHWHPEYYNRPYRGDFEDPCSVEDVIEATERNDFMALFHPRELL